MKNSVPYKHHATTCQTTASNHVLALQARLYSLQADPATYCNEPDGKLVWLLTSLFF